MRKFSVSLFLCFLLTVAAAADVVIVGETKVPDRTIVKLKVEAANPKGLLWDVFDKKTRQRVKIETDSRLQGECWFVAPPGEYEVQVIWSDFKAEKLDRGFAYVTILEPGPPPVPPDDPLVKSFKSAYAAEADPGKALLVKNLAALYRQAGSIAFLADSDTWGELFDAMAAAAKILGVSGKIQTVQKAVQVELQASLPVKRDAAVDKILAANTFLKIAGALEAVR